MRGSTRVEVKLELSSSERMVSLALYSAAAVTSPPLHRLRVVVLNIKYIIPRQR